RRHPGSSVPRSLEALREFYVFRDFPHFAAVYRAVSDLVTEQEDIESLVRGVARDMAAQNVRYAEIQVSPWYFTHGSGIPRAAVTEAIDAGDRADRAARATLDHALSAPPAGLVGFGVGGIEQGRVPHTEIIRDAFRAAV